ncbi:MULTISPECIES: STAS domain-containing protein [Variovorax]|jgi:rsbT co-antagonist protein RsbR|uniref:STAS domain-containing protein n=1 Tax=Variovorax TaxID=34072 RepID=UPI000868CC51|nr:MULTISPECIES: STAS domain-containing protein [Variovorax]MBN8754674.1 STAS domain-containing protein [Variovorax sp.]ODU19390.1 MAG: polyvinylalcohol dehydrogenase [Variovorax sp. SCN 67-85]ODV25291.1 MAG: polyvinylalcohol dehydrogenase [Variovorax sp. SCN 67-20]OJZ03110.1 MAG: polyvinylalcohol dehydrogenase [Variovorax sp. 67-131]UKI08194.1 STAS domain-containing protein [Variovorax paradoxus]
MSQEFETLLAAVREEEKDIVESWLSEARVTDTGARRTAQTEALDILRHLREALEAGGDPSRFETAAWAPMRELLGNLSKTRAAKGQSAADTSLFVLALKKPLFASLQRRLADDPQAMAASLWTLSTTVDKLAQHTVGTYQLAREEIIRRQQEELLELSTPVIKLWHGVLAVPMIGVLDSSRTQMVMEALLQKIVDTGSELAIIDITGVPTVDTLVAQHLLKTVTAIRLMGADCIISGVRPQIAQTIVHLGIDLQGVRTKATLADALALALQQTGWRVSRDK